jgi:hypothetical protein
MALVYVQNVVPAIQSVYGLGRQATSGSFARIMTLATPTWYLAFKTTDLAQTIEATGPAVETGLSAVAIYVPNVTAANARLFVNGTQTNGTGIDQLNTNNAFGWEALNGFRRFASTEEGSFTGGSVLFSARSRQTISPEVLRQWTSEPWQLFRPANSPVFYSLPSGGTFTLALDAGSYNLTGQDPGLTSARSMALDTGAYNLTGNGVDFSVGRIIYLDAGSYSVTGNDPTLTSARSIALDAGAYNVTGNDVTLVYTAPGAFNLALDTGTYSLTGNDVTFSSALSFPLDTGVYTLSGLPVGLVWSGAPVVEVTDRIITLRSLTERWRM